MYTAHSYVFRLDGASVGPEMNKFEQVSSDHHQISLAGGGYVHGGMEGMYIGSRGVYVQREVGIYLVGNPYHVNYPIMHVMYLPTLHWTSLKALICLTIQINRNKTMQL